MYLLKSLLFSKEKLLSYNQCTDERVYTENLDIFSFKIAVTSYLIIPIHILPPLMLDTLNRNQKLRSSY